MLLTEEQAKEKWCPFARVVSVKGKGGGNRWDGSGYPNTCPKNSLCVGSACMAWRWAREDVGDGGRLTKRSDTHGYCGLAGDPS